MVRFWISSLSWSCHSPKPKKISSGVLDADRAILDGAYDVERILRREHQHRGHVVDDLLVEARRVGTDARAMHAELERRGALRALAREQASVALARRKISDRCRQQVSSSRSAVTALRLGRVRSAVRSVAAQLMVAMRGYGAERRDGWQHGGKRIGRNAAVGIDRRRADFIFSPRRGIPAVWPRACPL